VALSCLLVAGIVLSFAVGANGLPVRTVLDTLMGGGTPESRYVMGIRAPRTAGAIAVGAALACAGALIQAMTRNPLADAGILGVNAGAAFAVALCVALLGIDDVSTTMWPAFVGALVLTMAVLAIGGRGGDPLRLTLAGVAAGAVLSGVTTGLALSDPEAFDAMRGWNAGTLLGRDLEALMPALPAIGLGIVIALACAPSLDALALGDDVARTQGVPVAMVRVAAVAAVTLLAGSATAVAGPIAFVGLMVPHLARSIVGASQRAIVAISLLAGPALVLLADVLGRVLVQPGEIPVGIVVAFVGAPALIAIARRRRTDR